MNLDPKLKAAYKGLFHRNPQVREITLLVPVPGSPAQKIQVAETKTEMTFKTVGLGLGLPSVTIPKKVKLGKTEGEKWAGNPAVRLFLYACHAATMQTMKAKGWKPKMKSIHLVPPKMGFAFDADGTCLIPGNPPLSARWLIQEGKPNKEKGPNLLVVPKKDDNWSGDILEIPLSQLTHLNQQIQNQVQKASEWHRTQTEILKGDENRILQALKKSQTNGKITHREIWTHQAAGTSEIRVAIKGISRPIRIMSHGSYCGQQKKTWCNLVPPKLFTKGPNGHLNLPTPEKQNQMWENEALYAAVDAQKAGKFLSLLEKVGITQR